MSLQQKVNDITTKKGGNERSKYYKELLKEAR